MTLTTVSTTVLYCDGVYNLNFLALLLYEILVGPKLTLRGLTPPGRPLAEKFLHPKRVLHNI